MNTFIEYRCSQRGAALMVSLLILVVLTILGLTGLSTTTLEERMTVAMQHMELTFQNAEAGINGVVTQATPEVNFNGQFLPNPNYVAANDPLLNNQVCQAVTLFQQSSSPLGKTSLTNAINLSYRGELSGSALTGTSLKVNAGFVAHVFNVDSISAVASSSTNTNLRQGVALIREGSGACPYLAQP